MGKSKPDVRPLSFFGMALTGVLICVCTGAIQNTFNYWISPLFFYQILSTAGYDTVWEASIAQGIYEGLLFGVLFSILFTTGTGIITQMSCSYGFALRHMAVILIGSLFCSVFGGLTAIGLATFCSEAYLSIFRDDPAQISRLQACAWVRGSIWGIELGGFVMVILGLVVLRTNWKRHQQAR
jgi:hypothetical protein